MEDESPGLPACMLPELNPDGTVGADRQQALDVARWRKAQRQRLLALRLKLPLEYRDALTRGIAESLDCMIPTAEGAIVSAYWPIRAEPDLRPLDARRARARDSNRLARGLGHRAPARISRTPPGAAMARGLWNIPHPSDGPAITPTVLLAPLVGFDSRCYRLGYGGGFFDRTLAAIGGGSLVIGIGFPEASIPTIFPQPHDIPMNWIVTGASAPLSH